MSIGTDNYGKRKCFVCGTLFPANSIGKPKLYCSDSCKDFIKYRQAMDKALTNIKFDSEHAKRAKGDLFSIANHVKASI